jgi:hypothetical protein
MISRANGRWALIPATTVLVTLSAASAADRAPIIRPDSGVMKLDEIGLYAVGYAYRGKTDVLFPVGWQGDFEESTGVCCEPAASQDGKSAFLLHCPWRGGTGVAFQEFRVVLPPADQIKSVTLRGATALRAFGTEKSDGATFHIAVEGKRVHDENAHRIRPTKGQENSEDDKQNLAAHFRHVACLITPDRSRARRRVSRHQRYGDHGRYRIGARSQPAGTRQRYRAGRPQ